MKDFVGTKVALINNSKVLVMLRDKDAKNFPDMWDLPGGAREEHETPLEVAVREIKEELGFDLKPDELVWEKAYPSVLDPKKTAAFMVFNITDDQLGKVVFGDEGAEWKMMNFTEFLNHSNAVPGMQTRLRDYLVFAHLLR